MSSLENTSKTIILDSMKKIAILGSTGYVGRSLLRELFLEKENYELFLFYRSKKTLYSCIADMEKKTKYNALPLRNFKQGEYDIVLNCTGVSSNPDTQKNPYELFKVAEEVDSLIINNLFLHPKTLYINISSGVVYGDNFKTSVTEETTTTLPSGFLKIGEPYAITKINAEAKHRALSTFNIVDIRVFGFFGSLVNTNSPFLMSEIVKAILEKSVFITNKDNIVRDYVNAKDIIALIKRIAKKKKINDYFDIYSKKPISKFDLIEALSKKYTMSYKVNQVMPNTQKIITKSSYFSRSKKATKLLGYKPTQTSLEAIITELDLLFPKK